MDGAAKVTSRGQVTVPKTIRDALGIKDGDEVVFRVEGGQALLARTPEGFDPDQVVDAPTAQCNAEWDDVVCTTRAARAAMGR
jgi:AbrB family looped-hinge helix DNA binding protein